MDKDKSIVVGSLRDVATQGNKSLAQTFASCDVVILVDTSASMNASDSRGGRTRYEVALEELETLQRNLPGRLAIIAFSNSPLFVPGGSPPYLAGSTKLADALKFAKIADVGGMRFIVISDGEPDDPTSCLQVAQTYVGRIDVIYVGPETMPYGRDFLQNLATAAKGRAVTADRVLGLSEGVIALLTDSNGSNDK